jgi:hypothetical protein
MHRHIRFRPLVALCVAAGSIGLLVNTVFAQFDFGALDLPSLDNDFSVAAIDIDDDEDIFSDFGDDDPADIDFPEADALRGDGLLVEEIDEMDEPTTGLHFDDIRRLLKVLHDLVDMGNSVFVIEHHMDVIASADWIIDMGPEGGMAGGFVVATGIPEDVALVEESHTGRFLREKLIIDNGSLLSHYANQTVT